MTEPTDAELLTLIEKHLGLKPRRDDTVIDQGAGRFHDVQRYRDLKADILAKWGTPPAVAGEPVAWLSTDCIGERYLCFTKPKDSNPARPLVFGDTAPQPTQAQAGVVPLTVDEVEQLIAQWSYELHGDRARYLVRMTEQHHGIKGDQHGAKN